MSQESVNRHVHESCLAGLELMLQHGLLTLEHPNQHEATILNQQSHLGLLPTIMTSTTERIIESKVDEASPSPSLISSWQAQPKQTVQFDDDGYVTFVDVGGKRLHRGFPCSMEDTVGTYSRLSTLNLSGTDLPLKDILTILNLPNVPTNLECLYLGGNGLGDEGATAIATEYLPHATSLRKLDLRYNEIQVAGMTALCNGLLPNVQLLYLEGNQVGNDGAVALSELMKKQSSLPSPRENGLREVFLGANQIQSEGAKAIAATLYSNKVLSKLYLEGNNIGLEGADAFSIVLEELRGDTALKNLYVDNNNIGKEGSKRLAKALNSPTVIEDATI